jgi:selenocysteine lyase/cysteine desulfurase
MGVYLNHAGTSWPKPAPVQAAVARALAAPPEDWPARFDAQHHQIAAALGYPADRALLTPGCTSALALALSDPRWRAGDRLVVSGMEHHALHRPALALADRGVVVQVAPRGGEGEPVDLAFVEAALRDGARMVAMTAASNVTGERLPVAAVVALCRAHGAVSLIDAAQLAGWVDDLAALGADLVTFAGHKGPQAPWGIGGLLFGPEAAVLGRRASGPPERVGWCDAGSVDRVAMAGLEAGLAWMGTRPGRLARALARVDRLAQGLVERGARLLGGERGVPVVSAAFDGRDPAELARALAARGVVASGGLQCARLAHEHLGTAPRGTLRFSVGVVTTDDDVDQALTSLSACLGG